MKINKLSMALVAAASLLAVSPLAQAQETNTPAAPARPRGGMSVESQMDRIDKAVTLTDAEKPKVKAALEKQMAAYQAARDETDTTARRDKMRAAREEFNKSMKEILTPEQYAKLPQQGRRGGGGGGAAGGGAAGGGAANGANQ